MQRQTCLHGHEPDRDLPDKLVRLEHFLLARAQDGLLLDLVQLPAHPETLQLSCPLRLDAFDHVVRGKVAQAFVVAPVVVVVEKTGASV